MNSITNWFFMVFYKIKEALAEGGIRNLIHKRVYFNRIIVPAKMNLSTSPDSFDIDDKYQFVEIKLDDIRKKKWSFRNNSWKFQIFHDLKKSWRCFALIEGTMVVGVIWCVTPQAGIAPLNHSDLSMLGINCLEKEAYGFNMVIASSYRGKNLAVPIQRGLHSTLKKEGFEIMYGAYWEDNLPALWTHRILKYMELPKRQVSRFFFIQSIKLAS